MWSDSQSRSEIPANLVVYVCIKDCKNVKIMSKNDFQIAPKTVIFDEMSLLLRVYFDKVVY